MDDGPLPDHFKALGVERNADSAAIKKAHRLLVLKCHPDKVTETDPDLKQQKAEQFHKIQKAYEVLIDEKERAKYEAELTLEALRKEKVARGGASSSREKSTRFDSRPSGTSSARYATEERRPSAAYDDDDKYYEDRDRARTSTRGKYDTYQAYPKSGSSPRTDKESSRSAKATTERHRSERTKARDKDDRRNHKFVSVDSDTSSADEKARYEADYKRRSQEDEARRRDADSRRKADDRRSYEDPRYDSSPSARKMSSQAEDAIRYLHKSRTQVESEIRPPMARTSSRDYYESSRSSRKESSRPEAVRRSSARPKDRTASSSARDRERDRGFPEIVEWDGDESSSRRMPSLSKHSSSPANIEIPRTMPQRSYTSAEAPRDHRTSTSPPPAFHRSQTMPSVPHASSRSSKPATVSRPSTLRETMTPEQSHKDAFPSVPLPQASPAGKSTKYYYPTPNGGVPLRADDILAGGHRTVLREPGSSQRHRSPEAIPMSRPPIGANRPSEANISKTSMPPPPMGRSSSSPIREERGRSSRPLYGEVGRGDSYARPRPVRQGSYTPSGDVQYAPKYGPEDVRWAPRGRENDRDYPSSKPSLGRTATYVY
jgi:curved DNA-binding protein CbpA